MERGETSLQMAHSARVDPDSVKTEKESDRCCASSHLKYIYSKDPLMTGQLRFVSLYKSFI